VLLYLLIFVYATSDDDVWKCLLQRCSSVLENHGSCLPALVAVDGSREYC
jgi:hypothetical protein